MHSAPRFSSREDSWHRHVRTRPIHRVVQQQLELMENGKVRTGEDIGSGRIDTTAESMERARTRLAELKSLLTDTGAATVSKPGVRS